MKLDKVAQYLKKSDSSARMEYNKTSKEIDKSIKELIINWERIQKEYDAMSKKNPTSWAGVGRGAELPDLLKYVKETADSFKNISFKDL